VTLYEMNDLEEANDALTAFLQRNNAPTHIEDVYRYKLSIAQKIADGAACHLFGWHSMPKLQTGRSIALEIFDEIASGLPNHDIAASALLRKAALQRYLEEFAPAVEVYQTAIRRFPGSSFALTAYQEIAATYVEEMRRQPHNVDALTLAEINLKEIKRAFPQAKEVAVVDNQVKAVKELYVTALYETGQLFERMSEPKASVLYYHLALTAFPTSSVAEPCRERLKALSAYAEELHVPPQSTL
jgi:tetratricopeptide (TPR) repeat protein